MTYSYFSRNGDIVPIEQAVVPLSDVAFSYGFGVYETIRIINDTVYFLEDHSRRLMESARIISLEHSFSADFVAASVEQLAEKTAGGTYNLKVLLIGGPTKDEAALYILCLNPLFPDRKLYAEGAALISYAHERTFPHAKSLDMLHSYLAYRQARQAGAYDALFVNRQGCVTEGSRTNFFCLEGHTIITANEDEILLGVMRKVVLKVARENDFEVVQKAIKLSDVGDYEAAFVTSVSSKIMPVRSIDDIELGSPPPALKILMKQCDQFMETCGGRL
jgi:branched-chain amino acid aminotransferase